MSTHTIPVIRVEAVEAHPQADRLEVVRPFGYQVCVRKGDFREGDLAVYIPPDSLVDTELEEFSFLRKKPDRQWERVRVVKLRGFYSQGLLIRAPEGFLEGQDVAEYLSIKHYEPLVAATACDAESAPPGLHTPIYDVESLRRYPDVLQHGELATTMEKIHGTSGRFFFDPEGNRFWVGSHRQWKKPGPNIYWRALWGCPRLQDFLRNHPELVAYAEVYGDRVQELKYGCAPGEVRVAVFDLWHPRESRFLGYDEWKVLVTGWQLPTPPILAAEQPFTMLDALQMAEGSSLVPGAAHFREGCVIRPIAERVHPEIGRVILKVVGDGYLSS